MGQGSKMPHPPCDEANQLSGAYHSVSVGVSKENAVCRDQHTHLVNYFWLGEPHNYCREWSEEECFQCIHTLMSSSTAFLHEAFSSAGRLPRGREGREGREADQQYSTQW